MRKHPRGLYGPRSVSRPLHCEPLEDRLAPANLAITSAFNCDGTGVALTNPVYGQDVYIRVNWNASGMAGTEQGTVRYTVNGVVIDSSAFTYIAGSNPYSSYRPTGFIGSTPWTVTVTVDPNNVILETNESDNTASFTVTPVAPTGLPAAKFITPLGRTANVDWGINNYADVNPTPTNNSDYRGGPWTYDGHDAIDAGPWGFFRMDSGFPIVAAADGTVTATADGYFDRETTAPSTQANFVSLNHGNGWSTEYYHLATNTITVKVGDTVKAGQVIGLMGSSGQSNGQHLHYTARFKGAQVESGMYPATYWANPLPYAGDVPTFGLDAVYTNYSPNADQNERGSRTTSFGTGEPGNTLLYFGIESYSLKAGENMGWKWYKPDGTLMYTDSYTTPTSARFFLKGTGRFLSDFQGIPGTWQVASEINGVEFKRLPITINATGEASARLAESGKIIIDERTTPLNYGSVASGAAGPTKTYTVNNHGGATLTLSGLTLPQGFSLSGAFPASIAPGSNATFIVKMDTTTVGYKYGRVAFTTNDPDTLEYNFNVEGTVTGVVPAGSPVIASTDAALGFNVKSLPRAIVPNLTLTDPNSTTFNAISAFVASGSDGLDKLELRNEGTGPGQIGVSGLTVTYGGVIIGTLQFVATPVSFGVNFNASATLAMVQAVMRNVLYSHSGPNTFYNRRTIAIAVQDSSGLASNWIYKTVTPSGVERAPTLASLAPSLTTTGTAFNRTGSFADVFGNSWTGTVNYGDGSATQALMLNPDKTFTLSKAYAAAGDYPVTVTITSDTGGVQTIAMTVTVVVPPTVSGLSINGGNPQRSRLTSMTVSLSNLVDAATLTAPGAVTLTRTSGGSNIVVQTWAIGANGRILIAPLTGFVNTITLTFDNADNSAISDGVENRSLSDGRWQLAIPSIGYTSPYDDANLRRLFGDANSDRTVNGADLVEFGNAFNSASNTFDFNNDGTVNGADLVQLGNRFGTAN
ncbi:hypothetical protein BH11PLA2_BH11PLA2_17390 [soil metagenome]